MASIQGLQQVKGLPAADFAQDDPVGPEAQCGVSKVPDGNRRPAWLLAPGFQSDQVTFLDLNLGRVFDDHDALFGRMKAGQGVQEGCFPGAGSTRNQDALMKPQRRSAEAVTIPAVRVPRRTRSSGAIELALEFPDGKRRAGDRAGRAIAATREPSGSRASRIAAVFADIIAQ